MILEQLQALGAYMNAGFVDLYDAALGKHIRLAQVTTDGDVVLTPAGEEYATAPAPVVAAEPTPELPTVDIDAELGKLIGEDASAGQ